MNIKKLIIPAIVSIMIIGCKDKGESFIGTWNCQNCGYNATMTISKKGDLYHLKYHGFAPVSIFNKEPEQMEEYIAKAESENVLRLENSAPNISNIILNDGSFEFKKKLFKQQ
ncbi:hypothetical protein HKZ40_004303 [Salmonella enterica]|nr:hypothetical protein [Salmonella enterica]EHP4419025.1 hypothetical protein [Salmonella enterica]